MRCLSGSHEVIRLWLSRGTDASIHEQLSAQLVLGIVSGRLAPGERLPSTRALARMLDLHPNTISAVYRGLADRGWVVAQRGSGMYVRESGSPEEAGVDGFVSGWIEAAWSHGFTLDALASALARVKARCSARCFLAIDPDPEFARIIAAELSEAAAQRIGSASCAEAVKALTPSTCVIATEAAAPEVRRSLGPVELRTVRLRSLQDFVMGRERPREPMLIAVASRSKTFLGWAHTLLSELGFPAESVLFRNPAEQGWDAGLGLCGIVAADVLTSSDLPRGVGAVTVHVVSDACLKEMRALCGAAAEERGTSRLADIG